jgi:hypothetical protein
MPVIPAIKRSEGRRIMVRDQPWQKMGNPIKKQTKTKRSGKCGSSGRVLAY